MIDVLRDPARRWRLAAGLFMIAAGAALIVVDDRAAASLDVDVVAASSTTDSASSKRVRASCPAGSALLSAGWTLAGSAGRAVVTSLVPQVAGVEATATEVAGGHPRPWSLAVRAVCGGVPAAAVTVVATDSSSSAGTARCPAGATASGGGFATNGADRDATVAELRPGRGEVGARLRSEPLGRWRVYAICLEAPARIVVVSSTDQTRPSATSVEVALCPDGWTAVGAGAAVDGADDSVVLSSLAVGGRPGAEYALATGHTVDLRSAGHAARRTTTAAWDLTTDVLCTSA